MDSGPVESNSEGIAVIDGHVTHFGQTTQPLTLKIRKNTIIDAQGDTTISFELSRIISTVKNAVEMGCKNVKLFLCKP